jgi:2-haloalkanoic acid dehalogenase type II
MRYLQVTYATGAYRPYEDLVIESAESVGIGRAAGESLIVRWRELEPWPEAADVLDRLAQCLPLGVVTNCSVALGTQAAELVGVSFHSVITAEAVGTYKPHPRPYNAAVSALGTTPARTLFVAGSPGDIGGASHAGMPVVWHNRIGLERPKDGPEPVSVIKRLDSLLELVG